MYTFSGQQFFNSVLMIMLTIMLPEWPESDSVVTSFLLWVTMKILKFMLKKIREHLYRHHLYFSVHLFQIRYPNMKGEKRFLGGEIFFLQKCPKNGLVS